MTQHQLPYLVSTAEELQEFEHEGVMVLAGFDPETGGALFRGTGNSPDWAWADVSNPQYLHLEADQMAFPVLVISVPKKVEVTLTDEVKQGGYLLAVEDQSLQPLQVPNWINPESLKDVTASSDQPIKELVYNARNVDYFGNRIFLITDPQAVRDYTVHSTVVFRSLNPEGEQSAFMILQARVLKKDRVAAEAGADDTGSWSGRK